MTSKDSDEEESWSKMNLAEEENMSCKTRFRAVSNMDAGLLHVHLKGKELNIIQKNEDINEQSW